MTCIFFEKQGNRHHAGHHIAQGGCLCRDFNDINRGAWFSLLVLASLIEDQFFE
jgi:hypothetical protein